MQFVRIPNAIYMPASQRATDIARVLPPHVPADQRETLEQALGKYDLTMVWTDSLLLDTLSGSCLLCGLDMLPAELYYHLHEAHSGLHSVVKSYVTQLQPHVMPHFDSDCACFACGQIFNTPAAATDATTLTSRQLLVQAHIRAQCPSVLQLAVLLSHIHYGASRLADGERWSGSTDAAIISEPSATPGSHSEAAAKPRRKQKPRRQLDDEANGRAPPPGHRQDQAQDQRKILEMMARLLLRVDRDLQVLQRETTFIFYFSCNEETGVLPLLLQAADKWHKEMQEGASSSKTPLRQVLLQTVIQTLATRVTKLMEAQEDSQLLQVARKSQILLENKTVPFMEWNGHEKRLQISKKTPVSLTKMSQHCTELMDSFSNANLIMKFHSLPTKQGSLVTPWRLQMSCREDRTYELLVHLAQSQIWTLLAASLKLHNQHQSSLATNIETSLGLRPNKGQGKGKSRHKGKALKELKTEA